MSIAEWMCWDGVNAPVSQKSEEDVVSEVTVVRVVVPTREVVDEYNRFDTDDSLPCPACGEQWRVYGKSWELRHTLDCEYITWLEQDCPVPVEVFRA